MLHKRIQYNKTIIIKKINSHKDKGFFKKNVLRRYKSSDRFSTPNFSRLIVPVVFGGPDCKSLIALSHQSGSGKGHKATIRVERSLNN